MDNPADNLAVTLGLDAAPMGRDERLYHRPLPVAHPELVGHSLAPPTKELESDPLEPTQMEIGFRA
jgi:hypothetical protein